MGVRPPPTKPRVDSDLLTFAYHCASQAGGFRIQDTGFRIPAYLHAARVVRVIIIIISVAIAIKVIAATLRDNPSCSIGACLEIISQFLIASAGAVTWLI